VKRTRISIALTAVTLVFAGVAGAAGSDREQVHLTAAGQAAAKAAVTRAADLGSGWTGGAVKPQLAPAVSSSFDPKQSDLVEIGAARTAFKRPGTEVDTEAQVLKTSTMVRLDWQRTVLPAKVVPCLRESLARQLAGQGTLVSVTRSAFAKVAPLANVFRALIDIPTANGPVRIFTDIVVVGQGQTELTVTWAAPYAAAAAVRAAEVHLLRTLVARVRPA
jgi:hypothetical protein